MFTLDMLLEFRFFFFYFNKFIYLLLLPFHLSVVYLTSPPMCPRVTYLFVEDSHEFFFWLTKMMHR